ncbi:MAG: MFS transporter [bacterium]
MTPKKSAMQDTTLRAFSESSTARGSERFILLLLTAIQFTNILDFVIMMPLGPQLMRIFSISTQQFGFVVSAYTFSAGASGFLAAFFLDRYDRKKSLLTLYAGFTIHLESLASSLIAMASYRYLRS